MYDYCKEYSSRNINLVTNKKNKNLEQEVNKNIKAESKQSIFILKTLVTPTNYLDSCNRIIKLLANDCSEYIVAANVHVIMTGYFNPTYQTNINQAFMVTPDGMPLVWKLRLLGIKNQTRVYGPDLMLALCKTLAENEIPIYLYGGTELTLEKLQIKLTRKFPNLNIVGTHSPPFRPLTSSEEVEDRRRIENSGAKVIFVGLGCPKQEEWMARQKGYLNGVMIGVGAAFRFHTGEVPQAPQWMMKAGLEWLYRLVSEPRRLWKRYVFNNPVFVYLAFLQLVRHWFTSQNYQSNRN